MRLSPYFKPTAEGDSVFNVEAVKIKFGFGALHEVGAEARSFGMKRVAIYTDKNVVELEPVSITENSLKKEGIDAAVYDEVEVEPTDRSFKAGAEFAKQGKFDGFVSVGGGSVMDTCKAANLYSTYPAEFIDYVNAHRNIVVAIYDKAKSVKDEPKTTKKKTSTKKTKKK